ncbi:unnamed protein product [Allacma fusca]|uniref:Immediate early response 3-interacting protein 1 n=1 Tax=Allacma fusca TaxID=39272 RepID=A0A8J2M6I8_9HEXA|nr:unnamed protein product [Allacma fusca]
MAVTFWNLIEATLLCLNAVCVLNEERFLSKFGFGLRNPHQIEGFGEPQHGSNFKVQALHIVRSIRTVVKIPLIFFNILVIAYKLIAG